MMPAVALAALLAAMLAGATAAQESGPATDQGAAEEAVCPDGPVPQIKVVADIADTVYDHNRPLAELGTIGARAATASGHDVQRLLGLTRQGFTIGTNTARGRIVTRADGGVCFGYRDGTLTLRLTTEIFIATELPADSCLYGQVLAHEERHAKVGRRLFTEFVAAIEKAISAALAEAPFVPVADESAAPPAAVLRLKEIIEPLYRDFKSTYRKRQAIIDTSGEFARVREACPGEQEKLTGQ